MHGKRYKGEPEANPVPSPVLGDCEQNIVLKLKTGLIEYELSKETLKGPSADPSSCPYEQLVALLVMYVE
ncbi:hypothetical protein P7K49_006711 [Saguinus oedipus]|uniref:Uncharacterized protein n=1 Tax=Saguinus oedipus TaxID=9490 RepID=A0ABQ9W3X8_SAGOE|nr:hypothetical protein P7K49_006711 [Saguinus oedipus]